MSQFNPFAKAGSATDTYTKTETDTLLAGKADIVNGKVPAAQLPSYVDDVLEYDSTSAFPVNGESGKIYVATDTNKTYRWGGSAYVEISESLALGETASTAYPGNKGKANADAIAKKPGEITTGKQYVIDGQTVTAGFGAEAFNDLTGNKASGMFSHAEGQGTTASGFGSHVEGTRTTASGNQSHAEGAGTTASGAYSHAEGNATTASGTQSHAEGDNTTAYGNFSHAEGSYTRATKICSHAEGAGTTASGANSHAEGGGATASGANSHAEGEGTKASSASQHAQGKFNVEDANDTYAFIIGNGAADNARHNAFAIDWNGLIYVNGAVTGVDLTKKPGEITTGKQYTIGGQTVTAGTGAEVFNGLTDNKASGIYSHAEGQGTTASGNQSHAEGGGTTASGGQSHVEGAGTTASGDQSHAEGGGSTASGAVSHAEGAGTTASGVNSHAEGGTTTAAGAVSHAEGAHTIAASENQHVQGKYNVEDSNGIYAFIIGNGTAENARHNAFAIDWNGLIYVNGSATGVDVKAFFDDFDNIYKEKIDKTKTAWINERTEYDQLTSDDYDLYFVVEE